MNRPENKTGVIAKRAFGAQFVEIDVAFEHDLARRWNLQVDGFTFHQFDRSRPQKSRN